MLIKISVDVWRDIFDFFHRNDRRPLALKFNEIWDYEFSDICQLWLHDWTKNVQFGPIKILPLKTTNGHLETTTRLQYFDPSAVYYYFVDGPFADVPMPVNNRDFKRITFCYLDNTALQFVHRLQPLFRNAVNLSIYCFLLELEATRTVFDHLFPLLSGGIETIHLCHRSTELIFTIRDRFPDLFVGIKAIEIEVRMQSVGKLVELLLQWLCTQRKDGEPRMLKMLCFDDNVLELIKNIRQRFPNSTAPVSFFIIWKTSWYTLDDIEESITQNVMTREQLVIRKPSTNLLHISRYPSELWVDDLENKMEETFKQAEECRMLEINFDFPFLGSEEAKLGMKEEGQGEDADNQPGPSKKQKII